MLSFPGGGNYLVLGQCLLPMVVVCSDFYPGYTMFAFCFFLILFFQWWLCPLIAYTELVVVASGLFCG
jgi:hypothetical protein